MGQGEARRAGPVDELEQLAGVVVARVRPNRSDRATRDDCFQAAYLAGLQAKRSAQRASRHTSNDILSKAMRTAVYRLLHQRKDLRESDLAHCA